MISRLFYNYNERFMGYSLTSHLSPLTPHSLLLAPCPLPLNILIQPSVEWVAGHRGGIAQDDEFHTGARDGHIHTSQIAEEPYLSLIVGSHE